MKTATVVFDMHGILYEHHHAEDGTGQPVEIDQAFTVLLNYYQLDYKIVIISSSSTEHSRNVLEIILNNYPQINREEFFKKIDILSIKYFGDKGNFDSWLKILSPYKNIEHIYEDGEYNLKLAGEAAIQLGFQPELHRSAIEI